MSKFIPIKYHPLLANIYILTGVFCAVIFLIGGYLLNNFLVYFYVIVALFSIYIGVKLKSNLYAKVSKNEIIVYGLLGQIRKHYALNKNEMFIVKNNKIYLIKGNLQQKLKINNWFVDKYDWQRGIELLNGDDGQKITKHLVDD